MASSPIRKLIKLPPGPTFRRGRLSFTSLTTIFAMAATQLTGVALYLRNIVAAYVKHGGRYDVLEGYHKTPFGEVMITKPGVDMDRMDGMVAFVTSMSRMPPVYGGLGDWGKIRGYRMQKRGEGVGVSCRRTTCGRYSQSIARMTVGMTHEGNPVRLYILMVTKRNTSESEPQPQPQPQHQPQPQPQSQPQPEPQLQPMDEEAIESESSDDDEELDLPDDDNGPKLEVTSEATLAPWYTTRRSPRARPPVDYTETESDDEGDHIRMEIEVTVEEPQPEPLSEPTQEFEPDIMALISTPIPSTPLQFDLCDHTLMNMSASMAASNAAMAVAQIRSPDVNMPLSNFYSPAIAKDIVADLRVEPPHMEQVLPFDLSATINTDWTNQFFV